MSHDPESQTQSDRFASVGERLSSLRAADVALADALDAAASALSQVPDGAIDREPAGALREAIRTLGAPLSDELAGLAGDIAEAGDREQAAPATVSAQLQGLYVNAANAHGAAVALFQTGRLLFVGAACDLALERIKTYRSIENALNALLPQVVAWELREKGLACHCICPMCGLGLCGCIYATVHGVDVAAGGSGVAADERGIPLRSPPRSGSQLADAGVEQWDHVVSVDGEPVRTVPELQQALRRHAIGEEVRLGVTRDGESRELAVKHVSDLP